ncbi:MAG: hypothetical protein KAQ90_02370, partial [Melioribacteraceae bacterium]|nr:hypothetical protein [Melioribacteraceae bacterium]
MTANNSISSGNIFKQFAIILIISFLLSFSIVTATDLKPGVITRPAATEIAGQAFTPDFVIENLLWVQAYAIEWYVTIEIKDPTGTVVYTTTISGVDLPAYSSVSLLASTDFTPTSGGAYTIEIHVNYMYDVNTTNDIKTFEFFVVVPDLGIMLIKRPLQFGAEYPGNPFYPSVIIENTSSVDFSAAEWYVDLDMNAYNAPPYSTEIAGVDLPAYSNVTLSAVLIFNPVHSDSNWVARFLIVSAKDQVSTNDERYSSFTIWDFPGFAESPTPADGATGVSHTPPDDLAFEVPETSPSTEAGVFLVTTPVSGDPSFNNAVTLTIDAPGTYSYTPPENLLPDQNYSWKVDLTNPAGTTEGSVWTFTTAPEPTDLGVDVITRPTTQEFENVSFQPAFTIRNYGTTTAYAGNWSVAVRTKDDGGNTVLIEDVTGVDLAAGSEVAMMTTASFNPTTSLNVEVEVFNTNDSEESNNLKSVSMQVYGSPSLPISPIPSDGELDVPYLAPNGFQFTIVEEPPVTEYGFTIAVTPETGDPSWADVVTRTVNAPGPIIYTHQTDLLPETGYSWRIDLTNPAGTTEGVAWTFITSREPTDLGVEEISKPTPVEFENVSFNP